MALSKEVKIDAINIVGDYRKIQIRIALATFLSKLYNFPVKTEDLH